MVKTLRNIIGVKPDEKSKKFSPPQNPTNAADKKSEDDFISATADGSEVPDVQDNPDRATTKKDNTLKPDGGLKQKLGEDQIDELNLKTLQSYKRKAITSRDRLYRKGDIEGDKSMSTNGEKYPEKQMRHQRNASAAYMKSFHRQHGINRAVERISKLKEK